MERAITACAGIQTKCGKDFWILAFVNMTGIWQANPSNFERLSGFAFSGIRGELSRSWGIILVPRLEVESPIARLPYI